MGDDDKYKWLNPATVMQAMTEGSCHYGHYTNVYTLTLCSAAPLHDHHVRQALTHLFRKVPTLRMCFRRREGKLWACEMDHEEIDFQVMEGEAHQVTEDLGTNNYNVSEGPMWCARLLTNEGTIKTARVELEADFPHTRTLALGNHHSIADGTTNTIIIECFLQILNDVIAGRDIDDSKEMGEYKGAKEIEEVTNVQDKELEEDPEGLKDLLEKFEHGDPEEPLFSRVVPAIEGVPFRTQLVETLFDLDTSSQLIKKCKQNGITVNSAVVALLNVSLVDFLRENGLEQEEYPISSEHSVSVRRYLPKNMANILGAHISLNFSTITTLANSKESFWEYAKMIHKNTYKDLDSVPLTFLCVMRRLYYNNDSFKQTFAKPHSPQYDYVTATTGNLDNRITTVGDHVRLGHLVRFSTNAYEPMMHMYHSFRGRFYYSLSYSVNLMTKETAQRLLDLLVQNLKSQV